MTCSDYPENNRKSPPKQTTIFTCCSESWVTTGRVLRPGSDQMSTEHIPTKDKPRTIRKRLEILISYRLTKILLLSLEHNGIFTCTEHQVQPGVRMQSPQLTCNEQTSLWLFTTMTMSNKKHNWETNRLASILQFSAFVAKPALDNDSGQSERYLTTEWSHVSTRVLANTRLLSLRKNSDRT